MSNESQVRPTPQTTQAPVQYAQQPAYGGLDSRNMMMFEANKKSVGAAYLLCIFLGGFGAHRFYLGQNGTAATMLILTVLGIILAIVGIGVIMLMITGIWAIVDLFLIPGLTRDYNNALANRIMGGQPA